MTAQIDGLVQRARELLAAEYKAAGRVYLGDALAIRAIVAALAAAPAADGWVLVPREPTEAMEYAAVRVWDNSPADPGQLQCASDTYAAMLAAAPQAQGERK